MSNPGIDALMQQGRWDEAILECKSILQSQPVNTRILGYLGMCHFRKGEFEKAIEPFRKASVLDPNFWEAGVKLAQCHDRLRRYEEAYSIAKEWLRVRPQDRNLQGLVEALKYQVRGNRVDGWERTAHLAHQIKFARD